jgi:hypothetical protein
MHEGGGAINRLLMYCVHRYSSINIEIANMHCQDIACTPSFYMDLTSADDLKLEFFMNNPKGLKVLWKYY